jgi:hypothetical protein
MSDKDMELWLSKNRQQLWDLFTQPVAQPSEPQYIWVAASKTEFFVFATEADARKMQPTNTSPFDVSKMVVFGAKQPAEAPDCRTCKNLDHGACTFGILTTYMRCTNGDQYQPAPKVVLWRTK